MDDIVNLNVGGVPYTTTRFTLVRHQNNMLHSMFSGTWKPAADGTYTIDRDGPTFRIVLNFLRQGELCLPEDFQEWSQLECEATFYQIQELVDAVAALKELRISNAKKAKEEKEAAKDKKKAEAKAKEKAEAMAFPETEFVTITAKTTNFQSIGNVKYSGTREVLENLHVLLSLLIPFMPPEDEEEYEMEMFEELQHRGEIKAERNHELNREPPINPLEVFQNITSQGFKLLHITPCADPDYEKWVFGRPVKHT